ncbi:MAG: C4-dicarboxylate ABC transporter substrate-binding protein, partial [Rhodocyclales bacterium]|nr:C4-dicarboxylate ABC transporter substrate-binding protein [Rhodocyclales bacterium]
MSLLRRLALVAAGLVLSVQALAAPNANSLRIGTLAPKNSLYHRQLMEMGEAWRTAQGEGAKYVIYPDGSQGGETDMVRRMRIGQLQG